MQKIADSIFLMDTLLSAEYMETLRRKSHFEPETSLMFAVLEDALDSYRKYAIDPSARGRRLFREVEKWVHEGKSDWLFSFENICESFHLDPDYLRKGLRQWRERRVKALAFPRMEMEECRDAMAS